MTLYQADCLKALKEIPDNSVDLVVTDPPYNTGMVESNEKARLSHFFNDNYKPEDYQVLLSESCKQMYRVLKENKAIYIYMNWKSYSKWIDSLQIAGFKIKNLIVWDKVIHGLNYQNYAYTHEFIIFAVKGNFKPSNKQQKDNKNKYYTDVWHIRRNLDNESESTEHHETQKAMEVVKIPILHGSKEGDTILDPFLGSGTTMLASLELGRSCIGIEIEPKYIDIAKKRLNWGNSLNPDIEWEFKETN